MKNFHHLTILSITALVLTVCGSFAQDYPDPYTILTFAGSSEKGDYMDGIGSAARFSNPVGVTVDEHGNLFVVDNQAIRMVTPEGSVTTVAGWPFTSGSGDGVGSDARFNGPTGIAVDKMGNLYVADTVNYTIRKITLAGTNWLVTTFAGRIGDPGFEDGMGSAAGFSAPVGLAIDQDGNLYVADRNNSTIRKITPAGMVTTVAGLWGYLNRGNADGVGTDARFYFPEGITVADTGELFVADTGNNTIRKITPVGTNWVVKTLAGLAGDSGYLDGIGASARFLRPAGVSVDVTGNIFVADSGNQVLRKITPAGKVTTIAGNSPALDQFGNPQGGYADGIGSAARFKTPNGITVDRAGFVYVADQGNFSVRKGLPPLGTPTILTQPLSQTTEISYAAMFHVVVSGAPASYQWRKDEVDIPGATNTSFQIDYVVNNDAGRYQLIASNSFGMATSSDALLTVPTNAPFTFTTLPAITGYLGSMIADTNGDLYFSESYRSTIQKVSRTGLISTVAGVPSPIVRGTPQGGSVDGIGTEARFNEPIGIAVDPSGSLYVADYGNSTIRKIQPFGTNWIVSTIAGVAGSPGSEDGIGAAARFNGPFGLAADAGGNLYVVDALNGTIRKMSPSGTNWTVITIAGLALNFGSVDSIGREARFSSRISGIAVDSAGVIYVTDRGNYTLRRLTEVGTNWVVSTVAGSAGTLGKTDGTGSAARFNGLNGVVFDRAGNAYVADSFNQSIRKVTPEGIVTTVGGLSGNSGYSDGTGSAARFSLPQWLSLDAEGNLFVGDANVVFRKGVQRLVILNSGADLGFKSNRFGFYLHEPFGQPVIVDSSTDLVNWTVVSTNSSSDSERFIDPLSIRSSNRFYRARVR
jgi:sugar lactone lactonase YvrE